MGAGNGRGRKSSEMQPRKSLPCHEGTFKGNLSVASEEDKSCRESLNLLAVVQLLSHVWFFVTPRTAARQASLSFTMSWSLLKLMSIESVMPSNHLILSHPFPFIHSIFPSIRVFSNESVLYINLLREQLSDGELNIGRNVGCKGHSDEVSRGNKQHWKLEESWSLVKSGKELGWIVFLFLSSVEGGSCKWCHWMFS